MFGNSRRSFLKITSGTLAALFGAKVLLKTDSAQAAGPAAGGASPAMVSESEPMAKSLGYHVDASKVDAKKWPKRAGAEGGKQYCWNCQFYQVKTDPKTTKTGPCTIFANKAVEGAGWCNSWTPNPKVKA